MSNKKYIVEEEMKHMIGLTIIVGATFSGKTTLKDTYIKRGHDDVLLHTTRPRRQFEVNGTDYLFENRESMAVLRDTLARSGMGYIKTSYYVFENEKEEVWEYLLSMQDVKSKRHPVIIVDVDTLDEILDYYYLDHENIHIVYCNTSKSVIDFRINTSNRSAESKMETQRRLEDDLIKLERFENSLINNHYRDILVTQTEDNKKENLSL